MLENGSGRRRIPCSAAVLLMGVIVIICVASTCVAYAETDNVFAFNSATREIELNSSAEHGEQIIPVNQSFVTKDNKLLRLTMIGLNNTNKFDFISALLNNYMYSNENGGDAPLKIIDESFVDAEKWDSGTKDLYNPDYAPYYYGYDSLHCWAASCANIIWMSGWNDRLIDPRSGSAFSSEDKIFEYYNMNFTDRGNDADRAIDWLFMGEYFASGSAPHPSVNDKTAGGLMKEFVSTLAQKQYDLVKNPEGIESMLKVSAEDRSVFVLNIGDVGSELTHAMHAVTGAGLITDPDATEIKDKYKAIILIDSDNDSTPTDEEWAEKDRIMAKYEGLEPFSDQAQAVDRELIAYKESRKEIRPNSYTIYRLNYSTDSKGTPYWEIVGYNEKEPYAIYGMNELMCPEEQLITECTETEGTKDVNENVDLTLDELFTTSNTKSTPDPYLYDAQTAKKYTFESGKPVNLNYFLANRSNVILDKEYAGGNVVTVDWKVTSDDNGRTVAEGFSTRPFDIHYGTETGEMLFLNKTQTGYTEWKPGKYTVKVIFNKDRNVTEAYYKNNFEREVHFTVTKKTNPMKVSGKTVKLSAKKLKKRSLSVSRKKAISLSKSRGTVTYSRTSVKVRNKKEKYVKSARYTKKITVNKRKGTITVKKGVKKGKYIVYVKVRADGDNDYKSRTKTVKVRITVR